MDFPHISKTLLIDSKEVVLEIGRFAPQANASVLARSGDTLVLAIVTASKRDTTLSYFPLQVEYQEKLYAGGRIKGSRWVKREGKPSDEAVLTGRLIDRSIRPLFPQDFKKEVQIVITVLSVDGENDPDMLALLATSAALSLSDIPWSGPIGGVRLGVKDNHFFINPVYKDLEFSDLNLIVSGTKDEIVMVEAGANEVAEEKMTEALEYGMKAIGQIVDFIKSLQKDFGHTKQEFQTTEVRSVMLKKVEKEAGKLIADLIKTSAKQETSFAALDDIKKALSEDLKEEEKVDLSLAVNEYFKNYIRNLILTKKLRADGRKITEIRPLHAEVGVLPRTHGSAIFHRGLTQALTITTLGSPSLGQLIENMEGEETKRYIHHYFMPPFSVGETGRIGWPSRREVGHGALAERALEPVLPTEDKFPYTIRVVSEIMSSNGSTSMASVCGSSLSLMDAGVPIKKPVAGIAMGLIAKLNPAKSGTKSKIEDYVVLTDIMGLEDHIGDMDFKVAGTADGITVLQMDVKSLGITPKILGEGLIQAKKARLTVLEKMISVMPAPRGSLSKYAPKVAQVKIDKEKIGEVIGPGGKIIRRIINETGVDMDVDDEGVITISSIDQTNIDKAVAWVTGLTKEVLPGEEYEGEVKRIMPFGAFVEILPGKEGLVHVSQMSTGFVNNPEEVVKIGQKVKVRVVEIDEMKRINLSMLFGADAQKAPARRPQREFRPGGFNRDRGGRPGGFFRKRF